MEIEFIEDCHVYLVNGEIVPSVTQIINRIFPSTYENVPKTILENSARFGTRIHHLIEMDCKGVIEPMTPFEEQIMDEFHEIKKKHNIEVLKNEQMVNYGYLYAGTYDMLAKVNGKLSLIDIKTTSKVMNEHLRYQLTMYRMAIAEEIEKMYCLWLPKKDVGRLIEVEPLPESEILKII